MFARATKAGLRGRILHRSPRFTSFCLSHVTCPSYLSLAGQIFTHAAELDVRYVVIARWKGICCIYCYGPVCEPSASTTAFVVQRNDMQWTSLQIWKADTSWHVHCMREKDSSVQYMTLACSYLDLWCRAVFAVLQACEWMFRGEKDTFRYPEAYLMCENKVLGPWDEQLREWLKDTWLHPDACIGKRNASTSI